MESFVSAWSTSPLCAGLSGKGRLDDRGVGLTAVSSRVSLVPTASGAKLRLLFSNEYGVKPLKISRCSIGITGESPRKIKAGTIKTLSFDGSPGTVIPAGKTVYSDPLDFEVENGTALSVTTYFGGFNVFRTIGLIGGRTFAAVGNRCAAENVPIAVPLEISADSGEYQLIPALIGLEVVSREKDSSVCVIFGDSTVANEIPRLLEKKLLDHGIGCISVTQEAIKGNRLVADGVGAAAKVLGEAGVKRFARDALGQTGVKTIVVKLGMNDIIHPFCQSKAAQLTPVTPDDLIAGYRELAELAHEKSIKIYFAELSPWKGYTRNLLGKGDDVQWTPEIDAIRSAVNAWFASSDCPGDGYIAFPALADPTDPFALAPGFSPDGIHFTPKGQQALVDAFPLAIFV